MRRNDGAANSRLTLNLGFRYEISNRVFTERKQLQISVGLQSNRQLQRIQQRV